MERKKLCLLFEHVFAFNYFQGSQLQWDRWLQDANCSPEAALVRVQFPTAEATARFAPGPPPLSVTAIYNHRAHTCNFKPMLELRAKVKYPLLLPSHRRGSHIIRNFNRRKKHDPAGTRCKIHLALYKGSSQLFLVPLVRRQTFPSRDRR